LKIALNVWETIQMSNRNEPYLVNYILIGIIGFAIGEAISGTGQAAILGLFSRIDWGRTIAGNVVTGLFAFLPAGFAAGLLCYRLLKAEGKKEGLTSGIVSFATYFVLTLLITISGTAIGGGDWGSSLVSWAALLVFALIFFPLGGFCADKMHGMQAGLPSIFRLEFGRSASSPLPPPPVGQQMMCPTCGSPLRYIAEYQKWYCDKEKKYV